MSVQRVKKETTATELATWMQYLILEKNKVLDTDKLDYYLAQIASEVRRSFVKNPATVKTSDFILKFENSNSKKPLTKEEATAMSKRYWFSITGLKDNVDG